MKHSVVIGGARGIGAGIASELRRKGWRVSTMGVGADEVRTYATKFCDEVCTQLDVRDNAAVSNFFGGIDELHGLVNCAGILA